MRLIDSPAVTYDVGETFTVPEGIPTSRGHQWAHAIGSDHHRDNVTGYRVIRTDWSQGMGPGRLRATVVAQVDGASNYGRALDLVNVVRVNATAKQYGVIETLYGCGCSMW